MSPGNGSTIPAHSSLWQCFNEAGTHESRKCATPGGVSANPASFNEAGTHESRKCVCRQTQDTEAEGFNEAGTHESRK